MTRRCAWLCLGLVWGCGKEEATTEPIPQPTEGATTGGDGDAASEDGEETLEEVLGYVAPVPDPDWVMPTFPMTRADGRLQITDLYLSPEDSFMWDAIQGVLAGWDQCMMQHADGCGYMVFGVSGDRHSLAYSKAWYADALDGPLEECLSRQVENLKTTEETPVGHQYIAAVGVAPSAEEMAGCIEGIEAPTEQYLRSRKAER